MGTSMLTSQVTSTKAQLNCTPDDNSASNTVDNTANDETTSSSVVTEASDCDATGLQQCVNAFSTGVAGATNMAAKCQALNTYSDCLTSKSAGCSDAQKNAFVGPVESTKASLSCDESPVSNAPLMLPNAFAMSIMSAVLVVVSVW